MLNYYLIAVRRPNSGKNHSSSSITKDKKKATEVRLSMFWSREWYKPKPFASFQLTLIWKCIENRLTENPTATTFQICKLRNRLYWIEVCFYLNLALDWSVFNNITITSISAISWVIYIMLYRAPEINHYASVQYDWCELQIFQWIPFLLRLDRN